MILKAPKALGTEMAMMHVKEAGLDMKLTQKDFIEQVSVIVLLQ